MIPLWLDFGLRELGVKETPGGEHTGRILEYHGVTTLRATQDEVPWCAAFACWCLEHAGVTSPRSARARDFLEWGTVIPIDRPRLGDILVFSRGSNTALGHVGFFLDAYGGMYDILNGNVHNRVCISKFGRPSLLGVRRPST